jgi:hypothetical protein
MRVESWMVMMIHRLLEDLRIAASECPIPRGYFYQSYSERISKSTSIWLYHAIHRYQIKQLSRPSQTLLITCFFNGSQRKKKISVASFLRRSRTPSGEETWVKKSAFDETPSLTKKSEHWFPSLNVCREKHWFERAAP